jgi:EpsI family protein
MKRRFFTHLTVSLALLISTFMYLHYIEGVDRTPIRKKLALFPDRLGEWQGSDEAISDWEIQMLGMEEYLLRRYSNGQDPDIWVYVGFYESQTKDNIIHTPKNCLPASGWTLISSSRERIHLTKGPTKIAEVKKYLVQKGVERDLVVYWYQSRGRVVANEYLERLYLIWDSVTKKRSDGALVRVYCSAVPDEISAWRHLVSFVQEFLPVLYEHLPDAQ